MVVVKEAAATAAAEEAEVADGAGAGGWGWAEGLERFLQAVAEAGTV